MKNHELKAYVFSKVNFDEQCKYENINDNNVESFNDFAFISIACTLNAPEHHRQGKFDPPHYFQSPHPNVLNIDFDDVESECLWQHNGECGKYAPLNGEQAKQLYDFILQHIGKNFYIHCAAGISRSQAVGKFIREFFPNYNYIENPNNKERTHNSLVYTLLKREYYKDNGFPFQS